MKGKWARRALWLWIALLGLIILALTVTPFFVSGLLEPGYQAFRRDIAREMRYVKPLPVGFTIVEEWEDCGQGTDPAVFERARAERSGARIELRPADEVNPSITFDPDRYRNPSLDELAYIYVAP